MLAFNDECYELRAEIKAVTEKVDELRRGIQARSKSGEFATGPSVDGVSEMIANATLALRHLEDAAMRLGKAVQAFDGGKSVYPK